MKSNANAAEFSGESRVEFFYWMILRRLLIVSLAILLGLSCYSGVSSRLNSPVDSPYITLIVKNQSFDRVRVYAGYQNIPVGIVNGESTDTLKVASNLLIGGGELLLKVKNIFANSENSPDAIYPVDNRAILTILEFGPQLHSYLTPEA